MFVPILLFKAFAPSLAYIPVVLSPVNVMFPVFVTSYAPPIYATKGSFDPFTPTPTVLSPLDCKLDKAVRSITPPVVPKIVAFSVAPIFVVVLCVYATFPTLPKMILSGVVTIFDVLSIFDALRVNVDPGSILNNEAPSPVITNFPVCAPTSSYWLFPAR